MVRPSWKRVAILAPPSAFAGLVLLVACSGGSHGPTAPLQSQLSVTSAAVVVGGQTVNGMTLHQGHGAGQATRFEVRLMRDGAPYTGPDVWMDDERPNGMGMMNRSRLHLYDDGTHGDRVPGDGWYCYEDWMEQYGCNGLNAPLGDYHFDFCATDEHGFDSNHDLVTVTIVP